ncbi:MAG: hypothetical protein ACSHX7_11325 [Luteolibacter sp.]
MTPDEAKDLSHLLARIGSHLVQSVAFVKDHDTTEHFKEYRTVVGKLMGDLYLDAMVPLYHRFPELLPDYLDGTYKIPESAYLPRFYGTDTGGGTGDANPIDKEAESGR